MAGEQEEVVRYSISAGMKFAKHIFQIIDDIREQKIENFNNEGGEVDYDYLNFDGYTLNEIDITHLEDFDLFEQFAKENGIQFAITEDSLNPEIEHLWFKASNQSAINTFMQQVFDYGDEVEKEINPEDFIDPEELIKRKKEEQEFTQEVKYKLHVQNHETHEYIVDRFESFDEMKDYLVKNYDHLLVNSNLDIKSFSDIHSVKELEKVLEKIDKSKVNIKLDRKPLLEKFAEKSEEFTKNLKDKVRDKIKHKVPEKDGR